MPPGRLNASPAEMATQRARGQTVFVPANVLYPGTKNRIQMLRHKAARHPKPEASDPGGAFTITFPECQNGAGARRNHAFWYASLEFDAPLRPAACIDAPSPWPGHASQTERQRFCSPCTQRGARLQFKGLSLGMNVKIMYFPLNENSTYREISLSWKFKWFWTHSAKELHEFPTQGAHKKAQGDARSTQGGARSIKLHSRS